jgi:hypothetical protein
MKGVCSLLMQHQRKLQVERISCANRDYRVCFYRCMAYDLQLSLMRVVNEAKGNSKANQHDFTFAPFRHRMSCRLQVCSSSHLAPNPVVVSLPPNRARRYVA